MDRGKINKALVVFIAVLVYTTISQSILALEIKTGDSEDVTLFLKNSTSGLPMTGANCTLDVWDPANSKIADDTNMTELGEGFYYFSTLTNWTTLGDYRVMAKCIVGSKSYHSAMSFEVVGTTVDEWFALINSTTNSTLTYLQDTVYPAVDDTESKLDEVLENTSNIWSKLVDVQGNVTDAITAVDSVNSNLLDVNSSMISEFDENKQRLIDMNTTINKIHANITGSVNSKLDTLQTDINLIKGYTDTLEAGQTSILGNISEIQTNITALLSELDSVQSKLDYINTTTEQVSGYVDTLEESIDCDGTSDSAICTRLATINSTVNTINTNTDTLESGQTTIQNYVDTLESGQTTIIAEVDEAKEYLNCTINITNSMCWMFSLIGAYTDTLESGQTTIQNYVDTVESTQSDMVNNLTAMISYVDTLETNQTIILSELQTIKGYTDNVESDIANLDSDLASWSTNVTNRLDAIDSNLSAIYTDTQQILVQGIELDSATNDTIFAIYNDTQQIRTQGIEMDATTNATIFAIHNIVTKSNITVEEIRSILNGTVIDYLSDINTTVTDIETTTVQINDTVNTVYSYLQNTIYPAVDKLENDTADLLTNSTNIWNKLVDIETNVSTNYNAIINAQDDVLTMNFSVMNELEQNRIRLVDINVTLNKVYDNITETVGPAITELQANITDIIGLVDTLESTQITLLADISKINDTTQTISSNTNTVINYVDTLEDQLNCNGTTDTAICTRLATINSTVNTINTNTDTLESGQTTISNYVDTLESGQTTLTTATTDILNLLNCSSSPTDSVCFRLNLIQGYTDTLESGQTTISNYVDTLEVNQTLMMQSLTTIEGYTDTLESAVSDLDSDVQSWATNATTRFTTIDSSISDIYTDTQQLITDMLAINSSDTSTLQTIITIITDANSTANEIKVILEGEITDYLEDINTTVTEIKDIVNNINTTLNIVYTDTQDLLNRWSTYNMSYIYSKLDSIDTELDSVTASSNNTAVLTAVAALEGIVNTTRAEIGFNGTGITAYSYIVDLDTKLVEVNASIINKIELEANRTIAEMTTIIAQNTTAILEDVSSNSNNLSSILDRWGTVTAQSVIDNVTENRNKIITMQAWLEVFNTTEELRHNTSQSLINDVLGWLGILNQTEDQRHAATQALINLMFEEVNNTKEISNNITTVLGYNGSATTLYDDIVSLINSNNNIITLAQEINLTTHNIETTLVGINSTLNSIYTDTQNVVDRWSTYNMTYMHNKLDTMDSKLDSVSSNNTEIQSAIAVLEGIVNSTRTELGFNGTSYTAYSYLVELDSKLVEVNASIINKIEFDANATQSEILQAIEANTSVILTEIDNNQADIATIVNKWGNVTAESIINNVTDVRNRVITLDAWMDVFNDTEAIRHNTSQSLINDVLSWLGIFNQSEADRHNTTQAKIDNTLSVANEVKNLSNDIIAQIGYNGTGHTVYNDTVQLMNLIAVLTGMVGQITEIDYVNLSIGVNAVALPLLPSNVSISAVMNNISNKFTRVDHYDENNQTWLVYNPTAPFGNTLDEMTTNKVYWIYANETCTLYIN